MQPTDDEDNPVSAYYGVAPTIAGILIAAGLVWLMFALADGFA